MPISQDELQDVAVPPPHRSKSGAVGVPQHLVAHPDDYKTLRFY